jgi:bleomycin hydrolase
MGASSSRPAAPSSIVTVDEKHALASLPSSFSSLQIASPNSTNGALSLANISAWESSVSSDPKVQLARTILSHSDIRSALTSRSARIADSHVFNNEIDFKPGPVTNQKSSGRCWLFATTNVIRYDVMKKLKLKEFQLSQVCSHRLRV